MPGGLAKSTGMMPAVLKQSHQRHGSNGKSAHASINVDTYYDVVEDVYVPGKFKRPYISISMEEHGDYYITPNVDLGMKPQTRSKE